MVPSYCDSSPIWSVQRGDSFAFTGTGPLITREVEAVTVIGLDAVGDYTEGLVERVRLEGVLGSLQLAQPHDARASFVSLLQAAFKQLRQPRFPQFVLYVLMQLVIQTKLQQDGTERLLELAMLGFHSVLPRIEITAYVVNDDFLARDV